MKRLAVCALCVFGVVILCLCSYISSNYTREAYVISNNNNVCEFKDNTGNTWTAEDVSCKEGDKVRLYMCTNNTDTNIKDDTIKKVKVIKED